MPHIIELDLTPADMFRQHPAIEREPHWLLKAVYGRDLLKEQLRRAEPNAQVPVWRDAPELDELLEQAVDQLGLREWARPSTLLDRARYLRLVLRMARAVQKGGELPDWRGRAVS